jgi:hypothetical protein
MSTSERDNDLWQLRQLHLQRSALFPVPCTPEEESRIRSSDDYLRIQAEFDAIFSKYGFNPNIFKERAGSKRGVLAKIKDAVRRNAKRSSKQKERQKVQSELNDDSQDA